MALNINPQKISIDFLDLSKDFDTNQIIQGSFVFFEGQAWEVIAIVPEAYFEIAKTKNSKNHQAMQSAKAFYAEIDVERQSIIKSINEVISPLGFECYEIDWSDPEEEWDLVSVTAYVGENFADLEGSGAANALQGKGFWVTFDE